jgi:stringent starvation protein B
MFHYPYAYVHDGRILLNLQGRSINTLGIITNALAALNGSFMPPLYRVHPKEVFPLRGASSIEAYEKRLLFLRDLYTRQIQGAKL